MRHNRAVDGIGEQIAALGALWERERLEHRRRSVEERRALPLAERVRRGQALRDLEIVDTDAAAGGRTTLWLRVRKDVDLEGSRISQGDPVRLWWDDPDGDDVTLAIVSRRQRDRLAVVIDGDVPERLDEGGFRLDVDAPEATFDRGSKALRTWRDLQPGDPRLPLRAALFGVAPPRFDPIGSEPAIDPDLNEPQRLAVARALAAQTLGLVLGPPGTGKTRTLAEVVRRSVARGERVLVTAASNQAVDNLAERLVASGERVLRLGHPARVSPAVEPHTLDAQLEATDDFALARRWTREAHELRRKAAARFARGAIGHRERRDAFSEAWRLMRDARGQLIGAQKVILARHRIVCATAAGADARLLGSLRFDRVVLDEATQATDPIALVALARAPRATLAGDPHQLPPTVLDVAAEREGLGRTFFDRLALDPSLEGAVPELVTLLEVQHRMHERLMRFPSEHTYRGRLRAHPSVAAHRLEDLEGVRADPLRPGPLVFLDTAGKGWSERRDSDDPSTDNPQQAIRVAAEVRRLLGRGVRAADVAVITPYLAQVRALRERLEPELRLGLEIGSVDGFQGREKEAVIVDLVRSNDDGEIGFLADVRRINVAITRARRFLMVVGDSATIGGSPYYAAFLAAVESDGGWRSAWDDDAPAFE